MYEQYTCHASLYTSIEVHDTWERTCNSVTVDLDIVEQMNDV